MVSFKSDELSLLCGKRDSSYGSFCDPGSCSAYSLLDTTTAQEYVSHDAALLRLL
jgi:hypothetical protein